MEPKLIKVVTPDGQIVHVPPGSSVYVDGAQVPDPTPVAMPLGFERPESLESMMLRLVHAVSRGQADIGEESIDDANDFDVDDDDVLEDTFTDSELHAILSTPEMREQFLREDKENEGGREADSDSRASRGREADDRSDEGVGRGREGDRVRDRGRERDSRGAARRDKGVEWRRAREDRDAAENSAADSEGDE